MSRTSSSMCTGVAGLITTAGLHPCDAIRCSVRFRCTQASWCTEIQLAPASAKAAMKSSGFSIIKWQSKGTFGIVLRSEATTGGPIVRFGTKCPSITSRCRTVPPPSMAARASAPSCAKLAERMEGASSINVALPSVDYTRKRRPFCPESGAEALAWPRDSAAAVAALAREFEDAHDIECVLRRDGKRGRSKQDVAY